ncbi:MAG: hypothetical protein KGL91_01455 [Xanthomonadaceae bacterium]|nr:hypothetical protein [Xanthomonadaceae bacterium]
MLQLHIFFAGVVLAVGARAAEPPPEVQRALATAQLQGVVHTLRTIPEACTRLEGRFTGEARAPYALTAVRTSARCQPRAALVDADIAKPSTASGWIFNDEIRVPSASCSGQVAVVGIWRKAAASAVPTLDAQGRVRVYLKDGLDAAAAGRLGELPRYAVGLAVQGAQCKP